MYTSVRIIRRYREIARDLPELSELPETQRAPCCYPTIFQKGCCTCNNLNKPLTLVKTTLANDQKVSPLFEGSANVRFVRRRRTSFLFRGVYRCDRRVYKLERGNAYRLCNQICTHGDYKADMVRLFCCGSLHVKLFHEQPL